MMAAVPLLTEFMGHFSRFAEVICRGQYAPQRRFLREHLWGVLRTRTAVVADTARALKETKRPGSKNSKVFQTEKRLLRNLTSERLDDDALMAQVMEIVGAVVAKGGGVRLALDRGDITHRRGHFRAEPEEEMKHSRPRGMQYAWWVHDGSESTIERPVIRPGWYYIAIQGILPDGRRFPVWRHLYSSKQPGHLSENHTTLGVLEKIAPYVDAGSSWLAADDGYNAAAFFRGLDDAGYLNWAVRAKRDRKVFDSQGNVLDLDVFASQIRLRYKGRLNLPGRPDEQVEFGVKVCHLKDDHGRRDGTARAVLAYRIVGSEHDEPTLLMVSRPVAHQDGLEAVRSYESRWAVEQGFEHEKLKNEYGYSLEEVRVRSFVGVQRILTCVMLACLFASLVAASPISERVLALVEMFKVARHVMFRMTRAIGEELLGRIDADQVRKIWARWLRHG